ncbi:MAG TPA: glycoside hydrolase family 20 zincin-like fold domain-containing protein, partial [Rhodanobacter sp.]|nr:glycoside hydrolase family 20 zincin-like fold domain-containing protein [Rhodanobacter sp.]
MTFRPLLAACAFLLFGALQPSHAAPVMASPSLIPLPAQMTMADGRFHVDAHTPIVLDDHSASTRQTAAWLTDVLARTRGLHLHVVHGAATAHAIVLKL